jgi:hypothetical protein
VAIQRFVCRSDDTAQIDQGPLIHLILAEQFHVVTEIAQKPIESPEGAFTAVEVAGEGSAFERCRLQHDEPDLEKGLLRMPAVRGPFDANQEQALQWSVADENFNRATGAPRDEGCVFTTGEYFPDGAAVEPVRDESGGIALLCCDGERTSIAPQVEVHGRVYQPAALDQTFARALRIPRGIAPFGTAKQFVQEISVVLTQYTALADNLVTGVTRFVLATWFIPSLQMAPWLSIRGRNTGLVNSLIRLLRCFCRRALLLSDVRAGSIGSLPLHWGLTIMLAEPRLVPEIERLLLAARQPDGYIVRGGRLMHAYGPIVTHGDYESGFGGGMLTPIEIPVLPTAVPLPPLQREAEDRIADEFQAKLLGYRLANIRKVSEFSLNVSTLPACVAEVGRSLAACTPDDPELQIEIIKALQTQQAAMRAATWTDVDVVLVEALLFYCHEGKVDCVYVGEVGKTAMSILAGRGEPLKLAPKNVAARLRLLGVHIEARDKRGYRVLLTQALSRQLHGLARSFDAPTLQSEEVRCDECKFLVSDQRTADESSAGRGEPNEPNVRSGDTTGGWQKHLEKSRGSRQGGKSGKKMAS